jgi:SAM-dependent methyltransferase
MSERDRFSLIGHGEMPLMNALAEHELVALLDAASITRADRVLDLGGGRADLARLCAARYGCEAISVDRSPAACESARARCAGTSVEIVCQDVETYLAHARPSDVGLVAALGALHAFGSGLASWTRALDALAPVARHVLVGDLVALGASAATEMDVATMAQIAPVVARAKCRVELGPERVLAYERAWCAALERYLDAHPGDPRSAWARERIAWSRDPRIADAWNELAFVTLLIPGDQRVRNA